MESPKSKQLPSWARAWEKRKRAHQAQGSALCNGQAVGTDVGTAPRPAADSGLTNRSESCGGRAQADDGKQRRHPLRHPL